jgi:hypothetical protein
MVARKSKTTRPRTKRTATAARSKRKPAGKPKTKNRTATRVKKTRAPARKSPARPLKRDKLVHLNIAEARMNISRIVNEIEASNQMFTLGRRNKPNALLLPYGRFEPLVRDDYRSKLAFLVVDYLMGDAPPHIRKPQIEELSRLPRSDLLLLLDIEQLPLKKERERELSSKLEHPLALQRLQRRFQIARTIAEARREGLYEASENLTGSVDMEVDG